MLGEQPSVDSRGAAKAKTSSTVSDIVQRRLECVKVLFRMDANRDGVLHAEEVPEGADSFVSSVAEEGELDARKPLYLNELAGRIRDLARARFDQSQDAASGEGNCSGAAMNPDGEFTRHRALKYFDINGDGVIDQFESAGMSEEQSASLEAESADRFARSVGSMQAHGHESRWTAPS
jgi:hypothetical protein